MQLIKGTSIDIAARNVEKEVLKAMEQGRVASEEDLETFSLVTAALEGSSLCSSFSTISDVVAELNYPMLKNTFYSIVHTSV